MPQENESGRLNAEEPDPRLPEGAEPFRKVLDEGTPGGYLRAVKENRKQRQQEKGNSDARE